MAWGPLSLSFPASWFVIETEEFFYDTAPELVNPHAFGLVHARASKAADIFAFGMLAWEVSRTTAPFDFEVFIHHSVLTRKLSFLGKVAVAVIFSVLGADSF